MNTPDVALLINLLGFAVGLSLYAMLLAMTVQRRGARRERFDFLLLATALLGLLWNAGELFTFLWRDFARAEVSPLLTAASFAALGFLPAVVVHSAWVSTGKNRLKANLLKSAAYALSATGAVLHFYAALSNDAAPSVFGLRILTFGYLAIIAALFFFTFKQTIERKAVWASALAVFAVSALHLSGRHETENSWLVELVGHQASLPLALAILYQDFRFAFADLFLKRALSLLLLAATAFGLYALIAVPLLKIHAAHGAADSQPIFILLGLWMMTALVYPYLNKLAILFVDKILLRRADYKKQREQIAAEIAEIETPDVILSTICRKLAEVLTANDANWSETSAKANRASTIFSDGEIFIPTTEAPFYEITLNNFKGARRLLSDEIEMLEDVALIAARRIDRARATRERFEREITEQQTAKLVSEAELRALRAQINPHFLFNALTTIGYLIQTAPEKALETLLQLTGLLRAVLRQTAEFSTLGDELKIIESYLEIERARFEERLSVEIEVSPELRTVGIP